jgi:hypothetical protein
MGNNECKLLKHLDSSNFEGLFKEIDHNKDKVVQKKELDDYINTIENDKTKILKTLDEQNKIKFENLLTILNGFKNSDKKEFTKNEFLLRFKKKIPGKSFHNKISSINIKWLFRKINSIFFINI